MLRHKPKSRKKNKKPTRLSFKSHGRKQTAFSSTRKTDVQTELWDLFLDSVQRMLHGDPEEHLTPLEDDDQGKSEPAGEVQSRARGPAVEIQVSRPGTEPLLSIPGVDLTEDGTKRPLAHVDVDLG